MSASRKMGSEMCHRPFLRRCGDAENAVRSWALDTRRFAARFLDINQNLGSNKMQAIIRHTRRKCKSFINISVIKQSALDSRSATSSYEGQNKMHFCDFGWEQAPIFCIFHSSDAKSKCIIFIDWDSWARYYRESCLQSKFQKRFINGSSPSCHDQDKYKYIYDSRYQSKK